MISESESCLFVLFFFFFQAEDGIRDFCLSRGLGDVYKRQTYNKNIISTEELLMHYFESHDPTQVNRQGNDIGPQYRSVVYYKNEEEMIDVNEVIGYLQQNFVDDIVTEVSPLINFYVAENYHHNYFANNPNNPYCSMVVGPKISKTRAKHASLYK